MDRETRDIFELMEEIENEFGIKSYPMNWPIGCGVDFKGVYDRRTKEIIIFDDGKHGQIEAKETKINVNDEKAIELIGDSLYGKLMEDMELLDVAGDDFDLEKVANGELTPVFFGSASTNFGVEPFLDNFLKLTSPPLPRNSSIGKI